jgi:hypothetical protein
MERVKLIHCSVIKITKLYQERSSIKEMSKDDTNKVISNVNGEQSSTDKDGDKAMAEFIFGEEYEGSKEEVKEISAWNVSDIALAKTYEFVVLLSKLIDEHKKVNGSWKIRLKLLKFVNTFLMIATKDFRDTVVQVDGMTYLLSDYKVDDRFTPLIHPRGVYANVGVEFCRTDLVPYMENIGVLSPVEFQRFQELILNKFKVREIAWNNDLQNATQPITISEALPNAAVEVCGAHCDNINTVNKLPIYMTINIAEPFYFNTPLEVYYEALAKNIIDGLSGY